MRNEHGDADYEIAIIEDITERKNAEEALKTSEIQLRVLADAIPQLVWMARADGYVFWYNHRWYEYTGTTPEEMEGWGWQRVHHPDVLPKVLEQWKKAIAQREPFEMEFPLKGKDGTFRWFLTRTTPVRNDRGEVIQFFGTNTDIDHQRREREDQKFLSDVTKQLASNLDYQQTLETVARLAVPRLADWVIVDFVLEEEGARRIERIVSVHRDPRMQKLAEELRKYRPIRGLGISWNAIHAGETEVIREVTDGLLAKRATSAEHARILRETGVRSAAIVPLRSRDKVLGAISFLLSAPHRGFSEDDLSLCVEVTRRVASAVDNGLLYQEARSAIQMRDEFLSIASHELKTPLTSLSLQLQYLSRALAKSKPEAGVPRAAISDEKLVEVVESCKAQSMKLSALLDELLDLTRIRIGKIQLARVPMDLVSLTEHIIEQFRADATARGVVISLSASQPVQGDWDPSRIEQVLNNLISNALKYGAGKPIDVRVEKEGETAKLTVQDRGLGIAPEMQNKIFDRFERAVPGKQISGLGLGLYITRQIVEAHGGQITLESALGRGSTFVVTLPLAIAATESSPRLAG